MVRYTTRCLGVALAAFLWVGLSTARAEKKFLDSDDAKEHDEPQSFLPDYDKLVKGSEADWVYFPGGGGNMKSFKTVSVKEFDHTGHGSECRGAARYWGDWAANPGVGLEIIAKDSGGKVVAEMRHKSKGSTPRDAVENGLE